jgi:hypothetical protein
MALLYMVRNAFSYITHWENWHWFFKYILIGPAWLWCCLKSRSFWFFTPSNPTIIFGGFVGETKREIYDQLPPGTYPKSIYIYPGYSFDLVEEMVSAKNFTFPLAVKPNIGMMGFMFRQVESLQQLKQYHEAMPSDYIIQELITYPLEISAFYYRFPNKEKGVITGFLKKECMEVTGDGRSTLKQLILNYPRARFRLKELFSKHESKLDKIIEQGEPYCLSNALNLSRGGKLVSLEHEIDERLLALFDSLSHYSGNFYYGRYDIRCKSVDDLKCGKNFSILEYNGCGAEPHHVYGNGNSFFRACKILIDHWNILYKISEYNHREGVERWSHAEGLRFIKMARAHFKELRQLDSAFEFKNIPETAVTEHVSRSRARAYPVEIIADSNTLR